MTRKSSTPSAGRPARGRAGRAQRRIPAPAPDPQPAGWTFLSNHAHVLLCLTEEPQPPLRDVARLVGITERSVQRIVADLEEGGYLVREREGRRNRYQVRRALPLRHPIEQHRRLGDLIDMVLAP
jgi:DNA-binding transcriptional ArsR family regulator